MTTQADLMLRVLGKVAIDLEAAQSYLGQLDGAMGDGDHGVTMTIGFRAVRNELSRLADAEPPEILRRTAATFQNAAGATVGALLGAALIKAAAVLDGKARLTPADLGQAFRKASDAVQDLGGAKPGDKTLVDCLEPAAAAVESAVGQGKGALEALEQGLQAARAGMESTRDMVAKKGRASRLGERTRGLVDPGAASCFLILQSAIHLIQSERPNSRSHDSQRNS